MSRSILAISLALGFLWVGGQPYCCVSFASEIKGPTPSTSYIALLENPRDSSPLRVNTDLFVRPRLSIGEATPLIPDPNKSWQTLQARLWFDVPHTLSTRVFLQGGVGLLHADPLLPSQSPWAPPPLLLPLGVGMDYPTDSRYSLTTLFSLNVTDVQVGTENSHLTPGLTFGIRF